MSDPKPPDIVVVVLDCVRTSDFPGSKSDMPFCDELRRESIVFPRATSPAPWTIPSHAGLFTGLTPWESGCHCKANIKLSSSIERVPARLAANGYRTLSLSANTFIQPSFGLIDGFQRAGWGGWWEPFLRANAVAPPNEYPSETSEARKQVGSDLPPALRQLLSRTRAVVVRHPFILEQASHLAQGVQGQGAESTAWMSRWIEPTFRRWVTDTPRDVPVFAFVNLLDAHEPYFRRSSGQEPTCSWLEYARTRQERLAWMTGAWTPDTRELKLLHDLYVQMIHGMDARLQALVQVLRDSGRWDNTMMVITSDHGQAFGEHGMLFHMSRVDDELVRIPLWLRLPGGDQGGSTAVGWASLIDVAPTALRRSLAGAPSFSSGVTLTDLLDHERPRPVVSISDGIIWQHFRGRADLKQFRAFDRVLATAYWRNQRALVDVESGSTELFRVTDGRSGPVASESSESQFSELLQAARDAGGRIANSSSASLSGDVEDRLRAWGYV